MLPSNDLRPNMASLAALLRMKKADPMAATGDPYLDQRKQDIATGDEEFAPSDLELQGAQNTEGVGKFTTPGGDYQSYTSRDALKQDAIGRVKDLLRMQAIKHQQDVESKILPEQVKGEYGVRREQARGQSDLTREQMRGESDLNVAKERSSGDLNVAKLKGAAAKQPSTSNFYTQQRAGRAIDAAEGLKAAVSARTTGILGGLTQGVWSSPARAFRGDLETLKSNIMQNELAEMRAASKTGGALGQVSDKEGQWLAQSLGNLDQSNSPEKVTHELNRIIDGLKRWEEAKRAFNTGGGDGGDTASNPNDPYGLFPD